MIRVLIVDDSPTVRQALRAILESDPQIKVVGMAANGQEGLQKTLELRPDLVTMDALMPVLNGIEATRLIMEQCPTPIIVVSAHTGDPELAISFNALRAGALQVLAKPVGVLSPVTKMQRETFVTTVKLMSEVRVIRRRFAIGRPKEIVRAAFRTADVGPRLLPLELVAMGSSTGGPAALHTILKALPAAFPVPIVIVQHMSTGFTVGLLKWLQHECTLELHLAGSRQVVAPGAVYFAPDDRHLFFRSKGILELNSAPLVNHIRPSATVLFESVARTYGTTACGVLLTGMGEDGAIGLKSIRDSGGLTLAQDEATSVVYGMPRVAAEIGACDFIVPLGEVASMLIRAVRGEL